MGLEAFNKKPRPVREALKSGDVIALRAMGKRGAEIATKRRIKEADEEDAINELQKERKETEERRLRESTNEHILSADGKDPDENS